MSAANSPTGTFAARSIHGLPRFEQIIRLILGCIAALTVVLLIGIFVFLGQAGFRTFGEIPVLSFLFGTVWNPSAYGEDSWGIGALFAGTAIISVLALLFAAPFGLAVAIYLSELASPRAREILKPMIEMIAGIPTVVLGLLGLLFVGPLVATMFGLSNGLNAFTAALLVAIAALPTIASISEDALSSVPKGFKEASLALGANQWTTIRRVVIPAAKSGITAAIMLGLGRMIGETMIVLMVAGNSIAFPKSMFDPVRPMTANIAIEIKEVVTNSTHWHALFAIGLVLFLFTFALNFLADILIHRRSA